MFLLDKVCCSYFVLLLEYIISRSSLTRLRWSRLIRFDEFLIFMYEKISSSTLPNFPSNSLDESAISRGEIGAVR